MNIFGHDGDPLGMDGTQVGVLKETHEIRLNLSASQQVTSCKYRENSASQQVTFCKYREKLEREECSCAKLEPLR